MSIKAQKLFNAFNKAGLGRALVRVADATYGVPELDYITGPFAAWWKKKLAERGLGKWTPQFDCDDFAWTLYTDIRWAHYATKKSNAEGISVGVMYYMAGKRAEGGGGGGHAINVAYVEKAGKKKLVFLEPQFIASGRPPVLKLTPAEIKSCWFINF